MLGGSSVTPGVNSVPNVIAGKKPRGISRALAVALSAVALAAAACGSGGTPSASHQVATPGSTATPAVSASPVSASPSSPGNSGSPGDSGSPGASGAQTCSLGAHYDQSLEDMLPDQVGPYELCKGSYPLSMFLNSQTKTNDKALYTDWMTRLNAKPEDTPLAVAMDQTDSQTIAILAFKPAVAESARLLTTFKESLDKLHWPNDSVLLAEKPVVRATDVGGGANGMDATGYAYAKNGVLFLVVTEDSALALQAFIALP